MCKKKNRFFLFFISEIKKFRRNIVGIAPRRFVPISHNILTILEIFEK